MARVRAYIARSGRRRDNMSCERCSPSCHSTHPLVRQRRESYSAHTLADKDIDEYWSGSRTTPRRAAMRSRVCRSQGHLSGLRTTLLLERHVSHKRGKNVPRNRPTRHCAAGHSGLNHARGGQDAIEAFATRNDLGLSERGSKGGYSQ